MFRAKKLNSDVFLFGHYQVQTERHFIFPENAFDSYDEYEVDPETLGHKWTIGIDTVVYGGDLFYAISSPSGKKKQKRRLCKVEDGPTGMQVFVWYKGEWWYYSYMDFTRMEIIGNIYDNAELLKDAV